MTNLRKLRIKYKKRLREIADIVGVTPATVHDAEVRGLKTIKSAKKYAKAFPDKTWQELID